VATTEVPSKLDTACAEVLSRKLAESGLSQEELANRSNHDRSHVHAILRGKRSATLGLLNDLLRVLGVSWAEFGRLMSVRLEDEVDSTASFASQPSGPPEIDVRSNGGKLVLAVPIDNAFYDVSLDGLTEDQYRDILVEFSRLLQVSTQARTAIAQAFEFAVRLCPEANPSDIWHHVLYRHFLLWRGSSASQSWVRTSGDAFELFLVQHYNRILKPHRIRLLVLFTQKDLALRRLGLAQNIGTAKLDILIEALGKGRSPDDGWGIVGGIHAKVSLAERITDDIPMSEAMMGEGLFSALVTLDVKSFPPSSLGSSQRTLVNIGELGTPLAPTDKREYVERLGKFSGLFSYNARTFPSNPTTKSGRRVFAVRVGEMDDLGLEILKFVAGYGT
jgi:transcriptional regulator with XRE-family HTH domain